MFLNQMEKKDFCVKATTKEIKDQFEGYKVSIDVCLLLLLFSKRCVMQK